MNIYLGDDKGNQVLLGTTDSDPRQLAKDFVAKAELPASFVKVITDMVRAKQR